MRSPVLPLTWHLARASGRRGLHSHLLAAGAAAVGAFVLLVMIAATLGSGARADHTTWRTPRPAKHGTAVQALATTYVRGERISVVSLAQLPDRAATPAPPGLSAFPKKGEVYVSPALAKLLHKLPADQLADRFPKPAAYGTIGAAGLAFPDELVAVVGRAPSDPAMSSAGARDPNWFGEGQAARAVVAGFTGGKPSVFTGSDQKLVVVLGLGLLVMPVFVLSSAAGRLGAARREQRLAALRLAGAAPRQILAMTAVEAAAVGAAGALTGALAYVALLPALAEVPYGVGGWYTSQLWVGLPCLAGVVLGVVALITVSAVSMLRQVATSPLGVAQQANPRRTRLIRLVLFVMALACVQYSLSSDGQLNPVLIIALPLMFYGAFWLFGPWVVDRLGRIAGRFAQHPATLLAARRLSDDPRGAWRTVSGLVLAGFAAGFFSVNMLGPDDSQYRDQVAVLTSNTAEARHSATEVRTLLHRAGVTATVTVGKKDDYLGLLSGSPGVLAEVSGGPERIDTALTALTHVGTGHPPYSKDYATAVERGLADSVSDVTTATLALGFALATASAGLTAAANVLDRRRVYGLLRLAGTPLRVLNLARIHETALPLVVLAGGTTAMGVYGSYQLNKPPGPVISSSGVVQLIVCLVLGSLAMFAAVSASSPLLRKVTADPAQTAD
ncbi:FtsX-like permease family protein [Streptomyces viridochromogenes]|nr:FtsX-like permease family protein [Streptomyces viridochromogenes]